MSKVRIAEYLDIDLGSETWLCHVCEHDLGPADGNYKLGCLVAERDAAEVYPPVFAEDAPYTLTTKPEYGVFVEFYCPGCGTMIVNECLPPGYPPPHDIQPDLEALRAKDEASAQDEQAVRAGA